MNSNTSGKRCEYTYQNYLEREHKLKKLKENYSTMEKQNNENKQKIYVLSAKVQSLNDQIAVKKNILRHYEKEFEDLIKHIEESNWRQTKAKTILNSEKEYLIKYEHLIRNEKQKEESEISLQLIEFNFNTSNLKEKRDVLEKKVLENNELIDKLIKEVKHTMKECDILQESIGECKTRLED